MSEDAEAQWVLYDKQGRGVAQPRLDHPSVPSHRQVAGSSSTTRLALPTTLGAGIGLAIRHALWNGSSSDVGLLLADSETLLAVLLQLAWLAVMVLGL